MVEQRGIEPQTDVTSEITECSQNCAKPVQISALPRSHRATDQQKPALPEQNPGTSEHEKIVPSLYLDRDLRDVVEAWSELSAEVRAHIVEVVQASR